MTEQQIREIVERHLELENGEQMIAAKKAVIEAMIAELTGPAACPRCN